MANDAIQEAVDNLRQAMLDADMDEGTVDAKLAAVQPNQTNLVGNFADLQRLGAREVEASGGDETFVKPPSPIIDGEPVTGSSAPNAGNGGDLNSMTKAELQARADAEGIDVPSGATKADLVAALGG
jgi:hypothetical protein